jgi:D-alanyl-D-alanine carboxypeptidase/D-alanyl-D-alanine-endopeptidase (penicillin-binding protein 4)
LLFAFAAPATSAPTATATAIGSKATETRNLPRSVEAALARGGVPRDAMVAWVQEVDAARPRLAWQADKPVNPASLMKLVTTFASLELLGPAYTWSRRWLRNYRRRRAAGLVIKGNGDPKLVLERMWL